MISATIAAPKPGRSEPYCRHWRGERQEPSPARAKSGAAGHVLRRAGRDFVFVSYGREKKGIACMGEEWARRQVRRRGGVSQVD